jgi:ribonuclease HI
MRKDGILDWAETHNCAFEKTKWQLIDCTHKTISNPDRPGRTKPNFGRPFRLDNDTVLKPKRSAKYLGVMVNYKLNWTEQHHAAIAKGLKWMMAGSRIMRSKMGLQARYARQLVLAVCLPKMTYAAEVWARTNVRRIPQGVNAGRVPLDRAPTGLIGKMQSVLRRGLLAAVGALRGTPTDTIEAHLNVLPLDLHLDILRHRALMRLLTLPGTHPLHQLTRDAQENPRKSHVSALHALTARYRTRPDLTEIIDVVRRPPSWTPNFHVTKPRRKAKGREEAIADDDARQAARETRVYSDGSAHDGGVGAAAHLVRPDGTTSTLRLHLGSDQHYTVHSAEGVGLVLALHLIHREPAPTPQTSIGIDNQVLIAGMRRYRHGAGQIPVDYARELIDHLADNGGPEITIRWTPGHCDIDGNEAADAAAKLAAKGPHGSTDAALLPPFADTPIPRSTAAIQQAFAARTRQRAIRRWRRSRRFNKMERIDNTMPSNRFLKLIHGLPRNQSTLLFWLRTGYLPLNHHLHRIHAIESPECEACRSETVETVRHYLLDCPAHEAARRDLRAKLGPRKTGEIGFLLSDKRATGPLMAYADKTKRFAEALGTLVPPPIVWPGEL